MPDLSSVHLVPPVKRVCLWIKQNFLSLFAHRFVGSTVLRAISKARVLGLYPAEGVVVSSEFFGIERCVTLSLFLSGCFVVRCLKPNLVLLFFPLWNL
jgi:hypothetical protein